MRYMTDEEIPAFVADVVATGCDICAVGFNHYCVSDVDLPLDEYDAVASELRRIIEAYGHRDHLKPQITAYLRSIGRYVDLVGRRSR